LKTTGNKLPILVPPDTVPDEGRPEFVTKIVHEMLDIATATERSRPLHQAYCLQNSSFRIGNITR